MTSFFAHRLKYLNLLALFIFTSSIVFAQESESSKNLVGPTKVIQGSSDFVSGLGYSSQFSNLDGVDGEILRLINVNSSGGFKYSFSETSSSQKFRLTFDIQLNGHCILNSKLRLRIKDGNGDDALILGLCNPATSKLINYEISNGVDVLNGSMLETWKWYRIQLVIDPLNTGDDRYELSIQKEGEQALIYSNLKMRKNVSSLSAIHFTLDEKGSSVPYVDLRMDNILANVTTSGGDPGEPPGDDNNFVPSASNTGPRVPRSQLTPSSLTELTQPGVYERLSFSSPVTILGDNITLRDCYVKGRVGIVGANARVEYVEIDGRNEVGQGIGATRARNAPFIYRTYIHHHFDLMRPGLVGIEVHESYFYDWGHDDDGNHADAIQFPVWEGTLQGQVILKGNYFREPLRGRTTTGAMGINAVTTGWVLDGNYFHGGGYAIYVTGPGYTMINNKFLGDYYWGPLRFFNDGANYGQWSGNTDENGNTISPPSN